MVRLPKSTIVFALLMTLLLGLTGHAFAAKNDHGGGKKGGGSTSGGTLTLVLLNGDTAPHYGGQVTFDVSTTATDMPSVKVNCSQGQNNLVYTSSAGFYPSYPWPWLQDFTLKSQAWTGGAADCTAELYYWDGRKFVTLTSIGFHADA
jgi:hypothetical protein